MHYFDSDVIFNYVVIQDPVKNERSNRLILDAISYDNFLVSTLVISEVGYDLARFDIGTDLIRDELDYLISLNIAQIQTQHLSRAIELSKTVGFKHINDCIHTAVAESLNGEIFYTYNKADFKRIQKLTHLEIIIL